MIFAPYTNQIKIIIMNKILTYTNCLDFGKPAVRAMDTQDVTFPTGTVLNGKWVILELLGKGGMGEVYHAHQLNLKRDVAIKVISQHFLKELQDNEYEAESCLERFRREVQVMAQVRHPNVVQIFDYGSAPVKKNRDEIQVEYIVLEYIPGATLRTSMSEEGFFPDEDRTRGWLSGYFLPLLDGVEALHELGIVHRDLKPENVLLDKEIPKIVDFGLARSCRLKPVTQSMDIKGTPPYMSPEHFMDLRRTDERADVYSLGKILFEAIAGKITSEQIPFKQAGLKDPHTPFFQELDRIIRAATAENKNERLASVEELKDLLKKVVEAGTGPLVTSNAIGFARNFTLRKTLVAAGAAALLFGVAAGADFMFFHKPQKSYLSLQHPTPENPDISKPHQEPGGPQQTKPAATLTGKDHSILHLVPGGKLSKQSGVGPETGKQIEVPPFYMDETQVTNYQYAEFLNQEISRIRVRDGMVVSDEQIWLFLGEVAKGYEPIMFQGGRFHLHGTQSSAYPVVRVTGYGAGAYARFFGRRLPTEREWLYLVESGGEKPEKSPAKTVESPQQAESMYGMAHHESQSPSGLSPKQGRFSSAVTDEEPNAYGIRGLNGKIGEWGLRGDPSSPEYLVMGGPFSGVQEGSPSIRRLPLEAFEEVGFRTVLSIP